MRLLLQSYGNSLYGLIHHVVKNREETEDVMQNVALKIWNNAHLYDDQKSTLFTWISNIARNAAIDAIRSKGMKAASRTTSISLSEDDLQFNEKENGIDIAKLNDKLPEKYRLLIEKMYIEGYTQQEISDSFNIPLGTVKTRLREAINMLRKELNDEKHLLYLFSIVP